MTDTPDTPQDDQTDDMPQTALDTAFLTALSDPSAAGAFYAALLDATLFMPVHDDFSEEEEHDEVVEEGLSVSPLLYEVEGEETAMVFDTEERLAEWADGPTNYIGLPGRALFQMFDGREQIALNLGVAPSSTILTQDDVATLHAHSGDEAPQAEEVPRGAAISVGPPDSVAEETVAALVARLAGLRADVAEAVLFNLKIDDADEPRLILGIVPSSMADANDVAQRVASAVSRIGPGAEGLEVAAMDGSGPVLSRAREVGLRLPMIDISSIH